MGIIQASSTTTDYVVALACLAAASECLTLRQQGPRLDVLGHLGLAAALALAAKPTSVAYLAPMAGYAVYCLASRFRARPALRGTAIAMTAVALLNVGHLSRNLDTYGSLLDPGQVRVHSNQLRDLRGVISNILRHAGLQAGTPSPHLNKGLALAVQWVHGLIGLDVNDPRTTSHGVFKISTPSTNEDRAGNPLHFYLLVGFVGYALIRRETIPGGGWVLLIFMAGAVLVFSYLFKWQIFAARYHLGLFVLAGGLFGRMAERLGTGRWLPVGCVVLLTAAWPWLVQIKSRPLLPRVGDSYVGSILSESRGRLYFANGLHLEEPYSRFADVIEQGQCDRVGIALSGNSAEYPLWVLLGFPRSGVEIGWIVSGTPSEIHADSGFTPCAVICEGCPPEETSYRQLPLVEQRADLRLFLDTSDD
jgi:hypothetical protein